MWLRLWLRGRRSVNLQAEDILTSINDVLAPEEPNVYRLRDPPMFGAPEERNVLVDEQANRTMHFAPMERRTL